MNGKNRIPMCACVTLLLISLVSAQSYKVIRLGSLGGRSTVPGGINSKGQVTGTSWIQHSGFGKRRHAFFWTPGKGMQDLGTLGGDSSDGFAVNNLGQVVGESLLADNQTRRAFLWTQSGGMQDLGTLDGESSASVINRSGEVVGWSVNAKHERDAFLWTPSGGMQDLGSLGGGLASATGITDDGAVVGWSNTATDQANNHIFLWTAGSGMRDLGKLGGSAATPDAINNKRTIVGYFFLQSNQPQHAFVRIRDMKYQDLGEFEAKAINASGAVVGYTTQDDQGNSAFLWTEAGGMQDLGKLIPPHSGTALVDARGINANGKVAALEVAGDKAFTVVLVPLAK